MSSPSRLTPTKKPKSAIGFDLPRIASAIAFAVFLAACNTAPQTPVVQPAQVSNAGEQALTTGIRAYDDGQYAEAETQLNSALSAGLSSNKDTATVYKYLAFIYCTSSRISACRQAFRSARIADRAFALSPREVGHPQWGPVYKQVMAE